MKTFKSIYIFLLSFFLVNNLNAQNVFIEYKVNDKIITNIDIKIEEQYLVSLNPKLESLDKDLKKKIATDSLIKEIIKIDELVKYFDLEKQNPYLKTFLKNYYSNIGFANLDSFKNHLREYGLDIKMIEEKLNYELLWNQLIFDRYNQQIRIDKSSLIEKINNLTKDDTLTEYNLSEIFFKIEAGEKEKEKIKIIEQSIKEIGFQNTANLYSISESSKVGGKIGWIKENNLSRDISDALKKINSKEYSDVIKVNNNLLILRVNEKRITKKEINKELELQKLIETKKNEQLNNFSKIYFDKIKINSNINEF